MDSNYFVKISNPPLSIIFYVYLSLPNTILPNIFKVGIIKLILFDEPNWKILGKFSFYKIRSGYSAEKWVNAHKELV